MTFNQRTKERLAIAVGLIFLIGMPISAWVPQPCPVLRKALLGCPEAKDPFYVSDEQRELNRYAHEEISSPMVFASVDTNVIGDQKRTAISFAYQPKGDIVPTYLQAKYPNGFRDLALVTHPLLKDIAWPLISEENLRLYQRTATHTSIEDFLANPPVSTEIAADKAALAKAGAAATKFAQLDSLSSLEGINYILTTYAPQPKDGSWELFKQTFNLEGAEVKEGKLELAVSRVQGAQQLPSFLLGTIHVNYGQDQ
ncbi:MAG: hypothetical protein K0S20_437 [Patescibacteria group bacterium]|jgi:hypothetical protein|nr:hypothetical protein [Patescibacteria group bacterium]